MLKENELGFVWWFESDSVGPLIIVLKLQHSATYRSATQIRSTTSAADVNNNVQLCIENSIRIVVSRISAETTKFGVNESKALADTHKPLTEKWSAR